MVTRALVVAAALVGLVGLAARPGQALPDQALLGQAKPAEPVRLPRLGLALGVPEGGGERELIGLVRDQIRLGLDGLAVSVKWADVEKSPGVYDWKPLDDLLGVADLMGAEVALTLQTIDTVNRTLPADLTGKPWTDEAVLARWRAFLAALGPRLRPTVKWISLGNEVNDYLGMRPQETEGFAAFVAAGKAELARVRPGVPTGVTLTAHGMDRTADATRRMLAVCDVVFLTYYPLGDGFRVRPREEWVAGLRRAIDRAEGKPVVLQELGLPSDPSIGGSRTLQAAFVDDVFGLLETPGADVRMAAFFIAYDFPRGFVDVLVGYYGLDDPAFRAYLGTLGLRTSAGEAKPAWHAFVRHARAWADRKRPDLAGR